MKPGDKVRVAPGSAWRSSIGDVIGTVQDATEVDERAWVHLPGIGYAQGWAWAEFEVVEAARDDVRELAEEGCSEEG